MKQNCDGKESGIIEIKKKSINEECKNIIEKKILNDTFIEKSVRKHNLKYDYSKTDYIRSCIKVKIICLLHGLFWMTPNNHLSGKGCPKCKFKKLSDDRSMGINSFIKKSKNSHKELYDYSKANYIN